MTFPAWIFDAVAGSPSYSASQIRLLFSGLFTPAGALGVRSGILNVESFAPSISGSTLTVAPGRAVVQGATTTTQGAYVTCMSASQTLTIPAPNGTYARWDLVYLRVWDNETDSSGQTQADLVYLAGTAAASPALPSVPAGQTGLPLIRVVVPQSGGGSPTATVVGPYTAARGGAIITTSSADELAITEPGTISIRSDLTSDRVRWLDPATSTWRSIVERHYVTLSKVGSFGLAASTYTAIVWDTLLKQSPGDTMWSGASATSLVAPVAGEYDLFLTAVPPAAASGAVHARAYVNGSYYAHIEFTPSSAAGAFDAAWTALELNAGDAVSVYLYSSVAISAGGWAPPDNKGLTAKLIWSGP